MSTHGKWLAVLVAAVAVASCRNATAPTPTTSGPVVPSTAAGWAIRLTAVTPSSGTTLTVHDCGPSWSGLVGRHVCTEDWRGVVEVVVNRDIANAVAIIAFVGSSGRCGEIYVPDLSFAAGQEQVVSTSTALYMTYESEPGDNATVVQRCGLPTRTEQVVVELWDLGGGPGSSATPVHRQAFNYAYEFILRERQ